MITRKVLIFSVCFLFACHTPDSRRDTNNSVQPKATQAAKVVQNYNYINLIPDSLRTPEQRQFIKHLGKVLSEHVKVKNNHMILTLSREQLVSLGIPSPYYDMIQKNLRDNNKYVDENNIKNLDSLWKETLIEVKDSFK